MPNYGYREKTRFYKQLQRIAPNTNLSDTDGSNRDQLIEAVKREYKRFYSGNDHPLYLTALVGLGFVSMESGRMKVLPREPPEDIEYEYVREMVKEVISRKMARGNSRFVRSKELGINHNAPASKLLNRLCKEGVLEFVSRSRFGSTYRIKDPAYLSP